MNSKKLSLLLDEISTEGVPQDVNLLPGILARIQNKEKSRSKVITKFAYCIIASIAALSILFFTIPGAASAMRKIFGFIPGIGLVDQTSPLRMLAGPVTETRVGFTVTVENGLIDAEHTVISYYVEGPFENEEQGELSQVCFSGAELRLPDGTTYQASDAFPDASWPTGYRVQDSFPPVPREINNAALILPCLHARLADQEPINWEIPLTFVAAPPDLTIYPVTDRVTPTPQTAPPSETTANQPRQLSIDLERVIPLPDGQLVQARVDWSQNHKISGVSIYPEDVKMYAADGREIPFSPSEEAIDPTESGGQSAVFGFKTAPIGASLPVKLVVAAVSEVNYTTSASFIFDPGSDRLPEQTWEINKTIELDDRLLRITTITVAEMGGNASVTIEMESPDGIIGAGVFDAARPPISGSSTLGSSGEDEMQRFSSSFNYDGGFPEGPISLTVAGYTVRLAGPWTLEWEPAVAPAGTPQSAQPQTACIDEGIWNAAQAGAQTIPAGLNGQVISEAYNPDSATAHLSISNLDSTENKTLVETGHTAAVSPDGSRLVYMSSEGISVLNIASGENRLIPETSDITGVFQPFWSPDGKRIAYTGTPGGSSPNLFLAELDGSNPILLPGDEPIRLMQGWLPDGTILYIGFGGNGPALKRIDPQSGAVETIFDVPELSTSISLSGDGRKLALNWRANPESVQTLFVFSVDGSQRKPLLDVSPQGFIRDMLWSPDGEWLLVDLSWNLPDMSYTKGLIRIDTCEIIPVKGIEGTVESWLP